MKWRILSIFLLILFIPLVTQAEEAETQRPNLTGTWNLNKSMSDDMLQMMSKAMGGKRGGGGRGGQSPGMSGGGGGRGGGGGGGGRGGGMNPGDNPDRSGPSPQARKRLQTMAQELSLLEIFHSGDEMNITNGLDISRLLHTDGRTDIIWTQQGMSKATARWEENTLVVRWKTAENKVGRTRQYRLIDDGNRMIVTEEKKLPNSKDKIKIRLVYDRQP